MKDRYNLQSHPNCWICDGKKARKCMTTDFSQIESSIVDVKKRDGRITAFNKEKITNAIYKALVATGKADHKIAEDLTNGVLNKLIRGILCITPAVS
jgi:transcriptional regulator NrdR family protein